MYFTYIYLTDVQLQTKFGNDLLICDYQSTYNFVWTEFIYQLGLSYIFFFFKKTSMFFFYMRNQITVESRLKKRKQRMFLGNVDYDDCSLYSRMLNFLDVSYWILLISRLKSSKYIFFYFFLIYKFFVKRKYDTLVNIKQEKI